MRWLVRVVRWDSGGAMVDAYMHILGLTILFDSVSACFSSLHTSDEQQLFTSELAMVIRSISLSI